MTDCYERTTCRLCGAAQLSSVLKLPDTPPANAFVAEKVEQKKYPLEVTLCSRCGHAQLKHVVDPRILFSDYCYVSGTSPSFVKHFENYAESINAEIGNWMDRDPFAVEIGSNDGTLLKQLQFHGWRVLGVEPAMNLAKQANDSGVPTLPTFFDSLAAGEITDNYGKADAVVANNVLAHIDDLGAVMRNVKRILSPEGVFVFEVQYRGDLLKGGMFDLVYHEHLDYHAVTPLLRFLHAYQLDLFDVERVPTHGGSIRCLVQHRGGPRQPTTNVVMMQQEELYSGALTQKTWADLQSKIEKTKAELQTILGTFKQRRCNIVAYGAPAKLTTFMYGLGLDSGPDRFYQSGVFDYVVDDSPLKQGKYTPGLHIPVRPANVLYSGEFGYPDVVVITAWNFKDAILEKLKPLIASGVHVVVPFPEVTVI